MAHKKHNGIGLTVRCTNSQRKKLAHSRYVSSDAFSWDVREEALHVLKAGFGLAVIKYPDQILPHIDEM